MAKKALSPPHAAQAAAVKLDMMQPDEQWTG